MQSEFVFVVRADDVDLEDCFKHEAASQEFPCMLASPANQSTGAATTVTDEQARAASILTLQFSGSEHEPVLLSPGKWNIGSAESNQILLKESGVAAHQFLIIVTEYRTVIKDWSGKASWNSSPFDNAILSDGDTVEVGGIQLSFRLAESLDLISKLPYVAESGDREHAEADQYESPSGFDFVGSSESDFVEAVSPLCRDEPDRLDDLIDRLETSMESDAAITESDDSSDVTMSESDEVSLESLGAIVDDELQQLEELRAAVRLEREQLLAKRELLVQETQHVESQLDSVRQGSDSNAEVSGDDFAGSDCLSESENTSGDDPVDEKSVTGSDEATSEDDNCGLADEESGSSGDELENEAVALEREKLRQYLEEFDSVEEAECDREQVEEEVEVAVGAAQAVSDYSVMNALRSRDDAVKRLDELVLAATGQEPQSAAGAEFVFDNPPGERAIERSGIEDSPTADSSAFSMDDDRRNSEDDSEENADTGTELEASIDELNVLIDEVDDVESESIDETVDFSSRETVSISDTVELKDVAVSVDLEADEPPPADSSTDESANAIEGAALTGQASGEAEQNSEEADSEDVSTVEFGEAQSCPPKFESENTDGCFDADDSSGLQASHDAGEPVSALTLQNLDIQEEAEEPSIEGSGDVGQATEEVRPDTDEHHIESGEPQSELLRHQPDSEVEEVETGRVNAGAPSWFDSKFPVEDASVAEDEADNEQCDSETIEAAGEATSECGDSAADVRQKLAEMFDLPELSENSASGVVDPSIESRLDKFRNESSANELAESDTGMAPSSWPGISETTTESTEVDQSPAGVANSGLSFESETLDEFPSTDMVSEAEVASESGSNSGSSFEPEQQSDEEESISAYMEQLLARNRQATGRDSSLNESAASAQTTVPEPVATPADPSEENESEATHASAGKETKSAKWLEENPRHRQNRDQVRAEVDVLRQIANQSARSAVATASRRDVKKQVVVKTTASLLALGSGVAALLLDVSMVFGLGVLGIGMFFSIDLTLTIFRNWMHQRDLQKAAVQLKSGAEEFNREDAAETA